MGGRNYGICHSCGEGFVRLLEVEKMGDSRGKFFFSCTQRICQYFDWKRDEPTIGAQMETNTNPDVEELTRLMKTCARVTKEDDVDVNLITYRKSKGNSSTGKEKIED